MSKEKTFTFNEEQVLRLREAVTELLVEVEDSAERGESVYGRSDHEKYVGELKTLSRILYNKS